MLASATSDQLLSLHGWVALLLVFLLPALQAAVFAGIAVPGELAILLGGVLAGQGQVPLSAAFVAAVAGAIVGDSVGYLVGKRYGRAMLAMLGRWVPPARLERAEAFLQRHGKGAVFLGRFAAPLRPLVPGLSGMAGMSLGAFTLCNAGGALVWAGGWTLIGYLAGARWEQAHAAFGWALAVGLALALAVLAAWRFSRGRRTGWGREEASAASGRALGGRRSQRGLLALAALLCAAAFAGVAADALSGTGIAAFDPLVQSRVAELRRPAAVALMTAVTWLGSGVALGAMAAGVGLWFAKRHHDPRVGLRLVIALVGIVALSSLAKLSAARMRPEGALTLGLGYAFPSGHAAGSLVGFSLLARLFARGRGRWARGALWAVAALLILGVGFSRIYLGAHWLSDVVGGYLLGAFWLLVLAAANAGSRRRGPGG